MASLGIPPIVHHLYNFGNLPVFVAFGRKYRKVELDLQGKPVTRRYVDFVMNTDERIVDGFYYATVMKYCAIFPEPKYPKLLRVHCMRRSFLRLRVTDSCLPVAEMRDEM